MELIKKLWGWVFGKNTQQTAQPTKTPAALPPLPVGSVAAIADALTQAGRVAEQQTALRNTPQMQAAKEAQQEVDQQNQIERDVANEDVDATRRDLAD